LWLIAPCFHYSSSSPPGFIYYFITRFDDWRDDVRLLIAFYIDEIPANVQVNANRKPIIPLTKENNCAFASILYKWVQIGKKGCIFAGISAKERRWRRYAVPSERLSDEPAIGVSRDASFGFCQT
ncbi:hypothetical protein, partial [Cohnella sp. GCM10012308]|uniref:hypothetical protein n=1 Tax=Cohnella sp. GCM10012308 TaxID=3317329 RepID=UPI0036138895